jgi:histidyl-tRNA synthetase
MADKTPQILKGFRDYLPEQQMARVRIVRKISEVFEKFGFEPMDTPALESNELFSGKLGEDEKLMYKFKDLGDREVALRYDLTVPLVRFISENKNLPKPFKRYQIGNVWRADKPQKARYREFMQCDIDIVGSGSSLADAEIMACLCKALEALGIQNYELRVNDRKTLSIFAVEQIRVIDKVDKIGVDGVIKMLKENGASDKTITDVRNILADKVEMPDEVKRLVELVVAQGIDEKKIKFDPSIARGLDYYTSTVFEFVLKDNPKFGSIAGGGRYDNLIGDIAGTQTPAVGGSIGLDRLFAALEEMAKLPKISGVDAIVFNLDEKLTDDYLKIAADLRNAGIATEFYYETVKLDKQFKYAEAKNIKLAVIYGSEEAKNKMVNIKNLLTKQQITVKLPELIEKLKSL